MRIACLQFAPQVGDVNNNLNRADAVLSKANPEDLDLLVLPELAFSGYNFKSLADISPFLEPTCSGITSLWSRTTALKYNCVVAAGYPEKVDVLRKWPTSPEYYNSAIVVNQDGETIGNYRKSHLYYTDETWALEGPNGFYSGHIPGVGTISLGICMDLNPYKFEVPWSSFEFAFHSLEVGANLVILSMAWLTREEARHFSRMPKEPDMETMTYWVKRLEPLIRADNDDEIIVVFANRTGVEDDAVYAGTSAVIGIQHGQVNAYGMLGRGEKELLVVDTSLPPFAQLLYRPDGDTDSVTHETATSRIFSGHVVISHEPRTPMAATLPTTPFEESPVSPRYFFLPSENLRTFEVNGSYSPTSSTRSNYTDFSGLDNVSLKGAGNTRRTSKPLNANVEKEAALAELLATMNIAKEKQVESRPERPSSPNSRNASRTGRGERSDSLLAQRPPSACGNRANKTFEEDSIVFRPESPKFPNASRNESRIRPREHSNDAQYQPHRSSSASRNQNRRLTLLDLGKNPPGKVSSDQDYHTVHESAIIDEMERNHSASPDLDKMGADLLVFEEGNRRPRRDSMECHADEDDFIVYHASPQKHQTIAKGGSRVDKDFERQDSKRPSSRKAGTPSHVNSPRLSSITSPGTSSRPQPSPNLTDARAMSHGRQRSMKCAPKTSSKLKASPSLFDQQSSGPFRPCAVPFQSSGPASPPDPWDKFESSEQPSPFARYRNPQTVGAETQATAEHMIRNGRESGTKKPTRKSSSTSIRKNSTSSSVPANISHETSLETVAHSEKLYATSILTVETTSAPATAKSIPPTPKAMKLSPDWDSNFHASISTADTISLKTVEADMVDFETGNDGLLA